MLDKLLYTLKQYRMVAPGDRVVCAVSGGADSVALLFALYLLREKLNICVSAAHFNHGLRGEESDRDEAFVERLCYRLDIPLTVGRAAVKPGKKGLEAAAREARYHFFSTLSGKIATAHTADDNAETVLMHMVRGTGLKGLGGIAPIRGPFIRPMLGITRQEVLAFLEEYRLQYVTDSSNESDCFLRNRLRHHVMPLLKQENPQLSRNMSAMALRLREDEEALCGTWDFSHGLDIAVYLAQPKAIASRMLAAFLESCGVQEPEAEHIRLTAALAESDRASARLDLPGGVTVLRSYGKLLKQEAESGAFRVPITCPGMTEIPQLGLRVHCEEAAVLENSADTFTVKPAGTLFLRSRQTGDSMRLSGGSRSLKKLFIDHKIPAHLRQQIPVLADREGVLGVYSIGVNLDRAADSLPCIRVKIEKDPSLTEK